MANLEFRNACYEVLEILKHVKEDDLTRIPKEDIEMLKKNANYEHKFEYNPSKSIKEQNVSKLSKGIMAMFFEKYTATKEQKEIIEQKRTMDLKKYENRQSDTYISQAFQPKVQEVNPKEVKLVEYKKDKWYIRILKFLKLKK